MPPVSTLKGYVMPIVTAILTAAIVGIFARGSGVVTTVAENERGVANLRVQVNSAADRASQAWEKIGNHLLMEASRDSKIDEKLGRLQQDTTKQTEEVKRVNEKLQEQSLLLRELLTEVKMRSPNDSH